MKVAIIKECAFDYNREDSFCPSTNYPEYPFKQLSQSNNAVYDSVRNLLFLFNMDKENYDKPSWNPLADIIKPGDAVFLLPNLVRHYNPAGGMDQVLTHGAVVRAVLDYVFIALKGKGKITIGNAPFLETDFEGALRITGIDKVVGFYNENAGIKVDLVDLRKGGHWGRNINGGDPLGYTAIDLGRNSEFFEIFKDQEKFRVPSFDKEEVKKHHSEKVNEYLMPNTVLQADVIVNIPKLKSHRKAGMTCALKGLVGTCGSKDYIPHHRIGSPEEGGDEYPVKDSRKKVLTQLNEKRDVARNRLYAKLLQALYFSIGGTSLIFPYKDKVFEGAWYGNDTIPRGIVDLNKIIFYGDKNGALQDKIQRRMFIVVDAIIVGEREGPIRPSPKKCGLLVAGCNPVAIDLVCSQIMGFDYNKIPAFKYALNAKKYALFDGKIEDIEILSDKCKKFSEVHSAFNDNFIPNEGWNGHIELQS